MLRTKLKSIICHFKTVDFAHSKYFFLFFSLCQKSRLVFAWIAPSIIIHLFAYLLTGTPRAVSLGFVLAVFLRFRSCHTCVSKKHPFPNLFHSILIPLFVSIMFFVKNQLLLLSLVLPCTACWKVLPPPFPSPGSLFCLISNGTCEYFVRNDAIQVSGLE